MSRRQNHQPMVTGNCSKGTIMIIYDWKTGAENKKRDHLQLCAYAKLCSTNPSLCTPGLEFSKEEHMYTFNGNTLSSVSALLDQFYGNQFYRDDKAAKRGTFVHSLCQQYVEHGTINWQVISAKYPEILPYMEAFRDFYDAENIKEKNAVCEVMLGSFSMGIAGRIDMIVKDATPTKAYNVYLKPTGKYSLINRQLHKSDWNRFQSYINVYNDMK